MTRVTLLAALFVACSPEETDPGDGHDHDHAHPFTLAFDARVGGETAACGVALTGLGESGATGELADARLYLSAIQLRNTDGDWVDVDLDDSDWQGNGVALLDFEDGTAGCADSGTSETNAEITGTHPHGTYDALRFDVGIPFELNHLDSATADPPLNAPGMFWAWQSGYKYLRVDWIVDGGDIPRWNVHIGAGGCESAAPTDAPTEECDRPNISTVTLEGFDVPSSTVVIDLGALVAEADVALDTVDSPPGCMSSPVEPDECDPVFESLGLDFALGSCIDGCVDQAMFSVE